MFQHYSVPSVTFCITMSPDRIRYWRRLVYDVLDVARVFSEIDRFPFSHCYKYVGHIVGFILDFL